MKTAKLSDFAEKIKDGKAPMPLLTCLHVRPKTSALTFQGRTALIGILLDYVVIFLPHTAVLRKLLLVLLTVSCCAKSCINDVFSGL